MPDRKTMKIEAHDAAGYETGYLSWSEYDDEYGNYVAHGDLSVQRMVEGGCRDATWPTCQPDGGPSSYDKAPVLGYDKEPFQSKAQARKFYAMEARGELAKGTASRWAHKTPGGIKGLPERKG